MSKLLLIDGNSLIYRAYYGTAYNRNGILKTSNGTPINAVITLNRMLNKTFDEVKPSHVFIAFDAGSRTKRHDKLESYKAGRQKTPEELIAQFPIAKSMISKMGIPAWEKSLIEADDILASLAERHKDDMEVIVMSSDKDLLQLVSENVSVYLPQNGSKPNVIVTKENFYEKYQINPEQVKDYKGIVGDSSDNLPGVKGIGDKGAIKLINEYNNLENIYENIDKFTESISKKLQESKSIALLCKELATLEDDVDVPFSLDDMKFNNYLSNELEAFFTEYELLSLTKLYKSKAIFEDKNNKKPSEDNNNQKMKYSNIIF